MESSSVNHRLAIAGEPPTLACFSSMLMEGVQIEADVGCSILSLLCDQIGLDTDYVNNRVQTVFMDGRPVDRLNEAVVKPGSVLALSAALPGVLGATLRKGGVYASLRKGITHVDSRGPRDNGPSLLTIKIFNVLLRELASTFFEFGVIVNWERLEERIRGGGNLLIKSLHGAEIDGSPAPAKELAVTAWPADSRVFFSITLKKPHQPS